MTDGQENDANTQADVTNRLTPTKNCAKRAETQNCACDRHTNSERTGITLVAY